MSNKFLVTVQEGDHFGTFKLTDVDPGGMDIHSGKCVYRAGSLSGFVPGKEYYFLITSSGSSTDAKKLHGNWFSVKDKPGPKEKYILSYEILECALILSE